MQFKKNTKIILDIRKIQTVLKMGLSTEQLSNILLEIISNRELTLTGDSVIDEYLTTMYDIKEFGNWGGSRLNAGRKKSTIFKHLNQVDFQDEIQVDNQDENQDENQDANQLEDIDIDKDIDIDLDIDNSYDNTIDTRSIEQLIPVIQSYSLVVNKNPVINVLDWTNRLRNIFKSCSNECLLSALMEYFKNTTSDKYKPKIRSALELESKYLKIIDWYNDRKTDKPIVLSDEEIALLDERLKEERKVYSKDKLKEFGL